MTWIALQRIHYVAQRWEPRDQISRKEIPEGWLWSRKAKNESYFRV